MTTSPVAPRTAPTPQAAPAAVPPPYDASSSTAPLYYEAVERLRTELGDDRLVTGGNAGGTAGVPAPGRPPAAGLLVLPQDAGEVATALRAANAYRIPVVTRCAAGAAPAPGSIVVSTERLNRILEISPEDELAVVQPGVLAGSLNRALLPYGLFYTPDPATFSVASIGDSVATNAGGLRSAKYGATRESVLALEVVLADGSTIRTGHRGIKGGAGLDLTGLFVGSGGVLGVIVSVTVRLRPVPVERTTLTACFDSMGQAAGAISQLSRSAARPTVFELFDLPTLENIDANSGSSLAAGGNALLLIEVDGYGAAQQGRELLEALTCAGGRGRIVTDPAEADSLWELRRTGRGASRAVWSVGAEVRVARSLIGEAYRELARIGGQYGIEASAVAHAWDGILHSALVLDRRPEEDVGDIPAKLLAAAEDLAGTAARLGGTIGGGHNSVLRARPQVPPEPDGNSLDQLTLLKAAFDPNNILNPGASL